jgi:hypothetical protein
MVVFATGAAVLAARAVVLLARGELQVLDRRFGPGTAEEELEAELADLKDREEVAQ